MMKGQNILRQSIAFRNKFIDLSLYMHIYVNRKQISVMTPANDSVCLLFYEDILMEYLP